MHDCNYDKVQLLARCRKMMWQLKQYKKDAKAAGHPLCGVMYDELEKDLTKHAKKLQDAIVGLAKEGKFDFCEKC